MESVYYQKGVWLLHLRSFVNDSHNSQYKTKYGLCVRHEAASSNVKNDSVSAFNQNEQ